MAHLFVAFSLHLGVSCLRESRVRENCMHGLGGGRRPARKRASSDPTTGDFPDPPGPRSLSNRFVVHPAFPLARSRAVFAAASISAFASSNVCWSRRLSSTYTPRFLAISPSTSYCVPLKAEWRAQCGVFILPL